MEQKNNQEKTVQNQQQNQGEKAPLQDASKEGHKEGAAGAPSNPVLAPKPASEQVKQPQ